MEPVDFEFDSVKVTMRLIVLISFSSIANFTFFLLGHFIDYFKCSSRLQIGNKVDRQV